MNSQMKNTNDKIKRIGIFLSENSTKIAQVSLSSQNFEDTYDLKGREEQFQVSIKTVSSLIQQIGIHLAEKDERKELKFLSEIEAGAAVENHQLITTVLSSLPYFERTLWTFLDDECNQLNFTASEVIQLNQSLNPLIGSFIYNFVSTYVEQNEEQRETINNKLNELSIPIIQVYEHIGVSPIIGEIDEERAHLMRETSLAETKNKDLTHLIIDLSGVTSINTFVAQQLNHTIESLKLMGVQVILTGLSPSISLSLVELGIKLDHTAVKNSLHQALSDLNLFK